MQVYGKINTSSKLSGINLDEGDKGMRAGGVEVPAVHLAPVGQSHIHVSSQGATYILGLEDSF